MVNHDQKGIEASGDGEVGDEITRDLLERAGYRGMDGGEWWNSGMGIGFVLLAGPTAFNILSDVGGETRPPEFSRNELISLQVAGVASSSVVVTMFEDGVTEGVIIGHRHGLGRSGCLRQPASWRGGSRRGGGYRRSWIGGPEGLGGHWQRQTQCNGVERC